MAVEPDWAKSLKIKWMGENMLHLGVKATFAPSGGLQPS